MKVLNKELPYWVKKLTNEVQSKLPNFDVYIAGGYLRDLFNGNQFKDVDLVSDDFEEIK